MVVKLNAAIWVMPIICGLVFVSLFAEANPIFADLLGYLDPFAWLTENGVLRLMFWAFATVMGLSLSTIFLRYTGESIAATFFATAGAFAGLSLFGYTTKKDLSGMGTFLVMGVIGLLIAMVINKASMTRPIWIQRMIAMSLSLC